MGFKPYEKYALWEGAVRPLIRFGLGRYFVPSSVLPQDCSGGRIAHEAGYWAHAEQRDGSTLPKNKEKNRCHNPVRIADGS